MDDLVRVVNLSKFYPLSPKSLFQKKQRIAAVEQVSLRIQSSKTLGLVGESGSGKSTLGKLILRLVAPSAGQVFFEGIDILEMTAARFRHVRKKMQLIFQDPFSSLNPAMRVKELIQEPLLLHQVGTCQERRQKTEMMAQRVGLDPGGLSRFPHEFSGGQRQRIGIARALILNPDFIVCDEAVSALDVSIQGQILNLLMKLQADMGLTYLFISHDLSVIRHISDQVAVMYLGKIVETGAVADIFNHPRHPYTRALLSANLLLKPGGQKRIILKGEIPSAVNLPAGCRFHTRCPEKKKECETLAPELIDTGNSHFVACPFYA